MRESNQKKLENGGFREWELRKKKMKSEEGDERAFEFLNNEGNREREREEKKIINYYI